MTLNELRYVVTLAQEQHFGRAAEKCFVSQPTLSIAVKKLEDELNITLFERSRNQVTLTPAGQAIVNQAQKVLNEARTIKELAQAGQDQLSVPLRVGAILTVGPYLFPYCIPQLREVAPNMPLVIEENYTANLRRQLRDGKLDVIIVALPFSEPDTITVPLYDEDFMLVASSQHELAEREVVDPNELRNETLLFLGDGHCFKDQVIESHPVFRDKYEQRDHAMIAGEGSSIETLRHMVASGMGLTVLPASAASVSQYQPGFLAVKPFVSPRPKRTVAMAYRASFTRPKAIEALKKAILQCPIQR